MAKLKFRDPNNNSQWIELEADDAIIDIENDPTENSDGLRTELLYRYENKLYYWNGEKIIELASNKVEVVNDILSETDKELIDNNSFVIINMDNDIDNGVIIDPLINIDSELSNTSTNPVQNKVITAELYGIEEYAKSISKALTTHKEEYELEVDRIGESLYSQIQNISALETNKQDKLTFDETPTFDSSNPVTSDGIRKEFSYFSDACQNVIDAAKNEAKSYTDEKVGDISAALTELHNYANTLKGGEA